jgi:hypothetical protein
MICRMRASHLLLLALLSVPLPPARAIPENLPVSSLPQQRAQPGQYTSAKGTVKAVTCKGTAIDLALDADGKALKLRADDYHKIELSAAYGKILPGFNVCEHLADLVVTARYKPTEANAGEVVAIQLP